MQIISLKKITYNCFSNKEDFYYEKRGNFSIKRNKNYIIHKYKDLTICIVDILGMIFKTYDFVCNKNIKIQNDFLITFYENKGYYLINR